MINILIIDDDAGDIKLIQKTLKNENNEFGFYTADSLAAGVKETNEITAIHLVLLDLSLPDSRGLETVNKFTHAVPHIPVIVLTGLDSEEIGTQAIHKGAQDYLVKGQYDRANLMRSIRYAIERHHLILEQKKLDKLKDEFISMASHELRTPMAIIQAAIANLTCDILGTLNDKQMKIAKIIEGNARRLNKIVTNLLDISRLESGQINPKFTKFSPSTLMSEVVAGLEKLAQEKGISLSCQMAQNIPAEIFADEELIIQIVNNLTSNSLRYAATKIVIEITPVDEGILFCIGNDGPHLSPDDIAKLFQKFSQIRRPQGGTGYKGTGLGLAICKEIVKKHNGKIWVESQEGGLTSFKFIIPKNQDQKNL